MEIACSVSDRGCAVNVGEASRPVGDGPTARETEGKHPRVVGHIASGAGSLWFDVFLMAYTGLSTLSLASRGQLQAIDFSGRGVDAAVARTPPPFPPIPDDHRDEPAERREADACPRQQIARVVLEHHRVLSRPDVDRLESSLPTLDPVWPAIDRRAPAREELLDQKEPAA